MQLSVADRYQQSLLKEIGRKSSPPTRRLICGRLAEEFHHRNSKCARRHHAAMRDRLSVRRADVEVVHLKLVSIYCNDVSLAVTGRGLFVQHLHFSFYDLILSVAVRSH
jgi:hypothetical protein